MDSDFWTSRLSAAQRQYTLHHHHESSHLDRLSIDDFEIEDDVRPDSQCPYCYEDFDIASLCSNPEDEHSCESKVTVGNNMAAASTGSGLVAKSLGLSCQVCPICSVKVARDMLSHITLQHGHLFKLQKRHRLRRVAIPSSQALSLLGRDLREAHLQMLLGGSGYHSSNTNVSNAASNDPFLSSLIMNFTSSEAEENSKSVVTNTEYTATKNAVPTHMWRSSFDPSLSHEEREKRIRQAAGRAGFVQDILLSTL